MSDIEVICLALFFYWAAMALYTANRIGGKLALLREQGYVLREWVLVIYVMVYAISGPFDRMIKWRHVVKHEPIPADPPELDTLREKLHKEGPFR